RECSYLYNVTGIPQYKLKEIKKPHEEEVNLVLFCCDICYNEAARCRTAEIFIRLGEGKSIYLCKEHAVEVAQARQKLGSYKWLADRFNVWKINDAMPKAVQTGSGEVVALVGDRGYMARLLSSLSKGEMDEAALLNSIKESSAVHRTERLIRDQINGLIKLGLVSSRQTGFAFRKRLISLTNLGKEVASRLSE
ncbi:MAG: hypothetical protein QXF01_00935, partial [Candidatus Micrarchaeaceae archaeon]